MGRGCLARRRDRVIPTFRINLQPFLVDQYFNVAISRTATRGFGDVSQCVLIPCLIGNLPIRFFHRIAREFGRNISAPGCRNVFRQDVAVTLIFYTDLAELAVERQRSAVDYNRFYLDALGLEQAQHISIAGLAAQLSSITDDEDYFAAGAFALAQ